MKKTLKKSYNKQIAGVCGGLAEYFGIDYTIARLVYTLLTIFTAFSGVLVYIILWIIMPEPNQQ
ncbi:PspC domain-containing protein [uncultured Bacteroides sp.]|uniref:PspC domain-containing protein n=1 Tax=uncultured Bacteroides sp. TaxID=162156 RepID=UPI002AAA8269|nr:PspC domain-containing protein [uncultured Bacteroides sp.]